MVVVRLIYILDVALFTVPVAGLFPFVGYVTVVVTIPRLCPGLPHLRLHWLGYVVGAGLLCCWVTVVLASGRHFQLPVVITVGRLIPTRLIVGRLTVRYVTLRLLVNPSYGYRCRIPHSC